MSSSDSGIHELSFWVLGLLDSSGPRQGGSCPAGGWFASTHGQSISFSMLPGPHVQQHVLLGAEGDRQHPCHLHIGDRGVAELLFSSVVGVCPLQLTSSWPQPRACLVVGSGVKSSDTETFPAGACKPAFADPVISYVLHNIGQ